MKANTAFKVIEVGIPIKSPDILSGNFPQLSQLIVPISDTLPFRATLWGLRANVQCSSWAHWKARSGLPINVN